MGEEQLKQLIKDHSEASEEECRWCFAIDLQRVKVEEIAQYDFPDATLVHLNVQNAAVNLAIILELGERTISGTAY